MSVELSEWSDREYRIIPGQPADENQRRCKICMDQLINIVFIPCGHLIFCSKCAQAMNKCPMCRKPIPRKVCSN